jgi:ferredoxin/flavodoxin---NADP+ reductase
LNEILEKREIAENILLIKIHNPQIAKKAQPGNFVILRTHEDGERFPLTIGDSDVEDGTITMFFMIVGRSTHHLSTLDVGDTILNVMGPLGNHFDVKNYGTVVVVGGGIGIAVAYPEAKALSKAGNRVISIIGARNKDLLLMEDELRELSDELYITTDDGSKGHKGFVTQVLQKLIDDGEKIDLVTTIGPPIMMKVVSNVTRPYGIKTIVNLNPIMLDGTGMCGGCRVSVGGQTLFACVDGPSFDGHEVDFDLLMSRLGHYREKESESVEEHQCNLSLQR